MGLAHSPSIVTNGLVFAYDMANTQKSFKGAPTTNLLTNGNFSNGVISPFGTYNVTPVTVSGVSPLPYTNYSSNYVMQFTSTTGTSGASMDVNGKCTVGQTYTFSFYGRLFTGPSSTVGLSFNNQNGSGDTNAWSSNVTLTNAWQKFTFTFTYDVAKIMFYFYNSVTGYTCQFTDFQLEQLSVASPFVNGTRSNTQAILDQTNNNTITANSLTYASDGTFSFNGSSNYITSSFATTSGQAVTYTGWLYSTETTATYRNFVDSVSQNPMIWWNTSGQIEFDAASYTTSAVYRNQWVYVALSKPTGSSAASYYVNGVLVGTGTAYTTPTATPTWFNRAGSQTWKGSASAVTVYNRALSQLEIQQNFNALRGRYGI